MILLMLNKFSIFYLLLMVYLHKKYKEAILVGQLREWPSPQRRLEIFFPWLGMHLSPCISKFISYYTLNYLIKAFTEKETI